jgi:ferredoxin-NADP reductase
MITTRLAGEEGSSFKKKLASLAIGKSIEMSVVEGDFIVEDPSREYVFIAGGIGITPFRSILTQADHDGVKLKATLIYANRNEDIVFKEELESFTAKNPELSIRYVIDPQRIDENVIRECVPDLAKPLFYISGPEPMVKALAEVLKGMGVPEENVKLDDFPGYPEY